MKLLSKFAILTLVVIVSVQSLASQTIRLATYNIKYDDTRDTVNNWSRRKAEVAGLINYHQFEVFGVQEALHHQLQQLKEPLPDFNYVGVGRDDGKQKGEYSALFYNSRQYSVEQSGTFWLSKTPQSPSKNWDAALPRICTWAQLEHKASRSKFYVFNTHFDHRGVKAREESAKVIMNKITELTQNEPVILMGDFNFISTDAPYAVITKKLSDTYLNSETVPYGPEATFNAFQFHKLPEVRIDYIFTKGAIKTMSYATLSDSKNMLYPSDHFPVIVELRFGHTPGN